MSSIDVRGEVDTIFFADGPQTDYDRRDTSIKLEKMPFDSSYVCIRAHSDEYLAIRIDDIDNLIIALEKAKEIWN